MKDLNTEIVELKLKNKELKDQLEIEVSMKNNMYVFILINGLMKDLLTFGEKHPLEVAGSSWVPWLKWSDKLEAAEKQLEKSIS